MTKVIENDLGYKKLIWRKEPFSFQVNWKQIESTLLVINCFACDKRFTKQNLEWFYSRGIFSFEFASREVLPVEFYENSKTIKSIRRIVLWAFLDGVSQDKAMANFPSMRKSNIQHHYYLGDWGEVYKSKKNKPIPSSSEIVLFDKIKSVPDFTETLTDVLVELEKDNKATVFVPKIKKSRW